MSSDIIARLLRACATGYGCRSVISPKGLGILTHQKLWPEAAEAILQLDAIHPRAVDRFLECWLQRSLEPKLDEDLAITFLRHVLPPYLGFNTILFRGQATGSVGKSWTSIPTTALAYALYGDRDKFPLEDEEGRAGAVVLGAIVPAANIICAPALLYRGYENHNSEYIVDPRGLEFSIEPASEAAVWISAHAAEVRTRVEKVPVSRVEAKWIGAFASR